MSKNKRTRVLVVGGGISGITAARVLANHFDEVVILERGTYPADVHERQHVPQGSQNHFLLARGGAILQELFPRLGSRLDEAGAHQRDFGADVIQYVGDSAMPRASVGIPMRCITRPLVEWILHQEIKQWRNVKILERHKVVGVVIDLHGIAVGATVESDDDRSVIESDLIIDASGRSSQLLAWLRQLGHPTVPEDTVDAGFRYASACFRLRNTKCLDGAVLVGAAATPPNHPISGGLMLLPGGDYLVTAIVLPERSGHITDHGSLIQVLQKTPCRALHDALVDAEPLSPVRPYHDTANRRRHYDRMEGLPAGLIAIGDSACVLNPRFGQGMTMAALGARLLNGYLTKRPAEFLRVHPRRWSSDLRKSISNAYEVPWRIATSDDYNWISDTRKRWLSRAGSWYLKAMVEHGASSPRTYFQQMRVAQMLSHPISLLRPDIALPIIGHSVLQSWR